MLKKKTVKLYVKVYHCLKQHAQTSGVKKIKLKKNNEAGCGIVGTNVNSHWK